MTLSWSASTSSAGLAGYQLSLNGAQVGTTRSRATTSSACLRDELHAGRHGRRHRRCGVGNHHLTRQTLACATDAAPPSTPGQPAHHQRRPDVDRVAWNASTDNVGVTGYRLYLDGVQVGSTGNTSYTLHRPRLLDDARLGRLHARGRRLRRCWKRLADREPRRPDAAVPGSGDTTPPSTPTGLATSNVAQTSVVALVDRVDRQRRRHRLPALRERRRRSARPPAPATPSAGSPARPPTRSGSARPTRQATSPRPPARPRRRRPAPAAGAGDREPLGRHLGRLVHALGEPGDVCRRGRLRIVQRGVSGRAARGHGSDQGRLIRHADGRRQRCKDQCCRGRRDDRGHRLDRHRQRRPDDLRLAPPAPRRVCREPFAARALLLGRGRPGRRRAGRYQPHEPRDREVCSRRELPGRPGDLRNARQQRLGTEHRLQRELSVVADRGPDHLGRQLLGDRSRPHHREQQPHPRHEQRQHALLPHGRPERAGLQRPHADREPLLPERDLQHRVRRVHRLPGRQRARDGEQLVRAARRDERPPQRHEPSPTATPARRTCR